jgi:FHS family L-fucose permease-like MFS transporter
MAIQSSSTTTVSSTATSTDKGALAMVTTLFFMWGFLTCLNDILIPHLKSIFDLNYTEVMLVQFAFFGTYFIFGVPAGKIVERIGYKPTMVSGLLIMSVGALGFIPAAMAPSFPMFLAALIILAAGITALQVSANPYVSVLGPQRTASSRLNLTQAFNSLGTTVAPAFGGILILAADPKTPDEMRALSASALHLYRQQEASSVKFPYLVIALVLIALAGVIAMYKLPKIGSHFDAVKTDDPNTAQAVNLWRYRHLIFGVIGIFVYVGAEVAIGSFLVNYFSQPAIGNLSPKAAAKLVSFYWGGAMVGRFIGSAVLQKLRAGLVLGTAAIAACILVVISMSTFGQVAMWSIILVGLFNSIMFPSIFTLGIAGLGPATGEGSGLLIAAIVGGAIIPEIEGALADRIGIHYAFIIPAICYLYIMYYGFRGSREVGTPTALAEA